jgi:ribosomal-protein-alanine N-acetyltransferase
MSLVDVPKPSGKQHAAQSVHLEPAGPHREREFLALVKQSRELHEPWVHPPATRTAFRAYIERLSHSAHAGYFVCSATGELVGVININEIVWGAMCSGALGYYAFAPLAGRGLMKSGLALVVKRAFTRHSLHRLEANIQPTNERSLALVKSLGFRNEGVARGLLRVGGHWRDHERWALTVEEWRGLGSSRQVKDASRQ